MTSEERLELLIQLGEYIENTPHALQAAVAQSVIDNPWFTEDNVYFALRAIKEYYLDEKKLRNWFEQPFDTPDKIYDVGLVLAGNVPMVGFHDVMTTFLTGHRAVVKCSSKDEHLIPHLVKTMKKYSGEELEIEFVDKLKNFDAVIATGSNHTAEHFERYFSDVPRLIRRNRNGIAVLGGGESEEELRGYGEDVFRHLGLGCRNVSKIYLPEGFELNRLMEAFQAWKQVVENEKYKHNFDFNLSTVLINQEPHTADDFVVLLPREPIISRIGTIHYEYYSDLSNLKEQLHQKKDKIQCISTPLSMEEFPTVRPGRTQRPALNEYADGVDTLKFLQNL